MKQGMRKGGLVVALVAMIVGVLAGPAGAGPEARNSQVRGVATFVATETCFGLDLAPPQDGWGLDGCLSVLEISDDRMSPGGVYQEYGSERFDGSMVHSEGGVPDESTRVWGTFDTEYLITSKWAGAPFASEQFHGRCQHPITSGTGAFEGATGRIDFKDNIVGGVAEDFSYKGHIRHG